MVYDGEREEYIEEELYSTDPPLYNNGQPVDPKRRWRKRRDEPDAEPSADRPEQHR